MHLFTANASTRKCFLLLITLLNVVFLSAQDVLISEVIVHNPSDILSQYPGNLTINSSGSLVNEGTLYIQGNFTNGGSGFSGGSSGILTFNGSSAQQISGGLECYNLELNNTNGLSLVAQDITLNGCLTFTAGKISTGSNSVIFGPNATTASTAASRFVEGKAAKIFDLPGTFQFPVGVSGVYSPLSLDLSSLTGSATLTSQVISGIIPGTIPAEIDPFLSRYWLISSQGGSNFQYTLTLEDPTFSPVKSVFMLKGDGITNQYYPTTAPSYTNTQSFSDFGNYSLGEAQGFTWTGTSSTDWSTGSNWNLGVIPSGVDIVSIPSSAINQPHITASVSSPSECYNLEIQDGAILTIDPAKALTVNNTLSNLSGTSGLVIQSDTVGTGSLMHTTANVQATVRRYVTGSSDLNAMSYHMLSVPIHPADTVRSEVFSGSYLYDFDVAANSWNGLGTSVNTILDHMKGYMTYSPENSHTYSFSGRLNSGNFTPTTLPDGQGYNLVPNPYPSAIDWDSPSGWTRTDLANSFYLWPAGGSNYISYVDGVVTPGGTASPSIIPVGQSYFVKAINGSPLITTNNAVRVHHGRSFLKAGETISNLLRIRATVEGKSDEAVVRFREMATENADAEYDAWKLEGLANAPQLFTLSGNNERLSINSLPEQIESYDVPMVFSFEKEAQVTFSFSEIESFDPGIAIELLDYKTGQLTNIRQSPEYNFTYVPGDTSNRFSVQIGKTFGIDNNENDNTGIWFVKNYMCISTFQPSERPVSLTVYNTAGQVLYQKELRLDSFNKIQLPFRGPVIVKLIDRKYVKNTKGILTD